MKAKKLALSVILCTIVLSLLVQLVVGGKNFRVHQHLEAQMVDADVEEPLGCVTNTSASEFQYDSAAVDVAKLETHLPLVIIESTDDIPGAPYYEEGNRHRLYTTAENGEEYVVSRVRFIDNKDGLNHYDDPSATVTNAKLRVRGNTSRWFDKKSYSIKLIDNDGLNLNRELLGMESNNDWALHGPFLDKTLMRNYMAMNISGELMDYAPDVRFCELIEGGEYRGVYLLMETVSRGKGRADVETPQRAKNMTGYIIELDNNTIFPPEAMNNFTKYTSVLRYNAFFSIVYPGTLQLTPELKSFIERDVSKHEKALYSYDYDSLRYGFGTFVDVDEFVDYFILMELFLQHDTGNLSTYFYKSIKGPYKPCVWDFNNDLENITSQSEDDFFIRKFVCVQAPWFWMMIKEESFTERVIGRYRELRKGILSDANMSAYIDDTRAYLGTAVDRNFAVWGYSFDTNNVDMRNKLYPDERNPTDYDQAVEQMKQTLLGRAGWLDENIEVLRQYSHESAVKKFNH